MKESGEDLECVVLLEGASEQLLWLEYEILCVYYHFLKKEVIHKSTSLIIGTFLSPMFMKSTYS